LLPVNAYEYVALAKFHIVSFQWELSSPGSESVTLRFHVCHEICLQGSAITVFEANTGFSTLQFSDAQKESARIKSSLFSKEMRS
jgi:hypothetical protein